MACCPDLSRGAARSHVSRRQRIRARQSSSANRTLVIRLIGVPGLCDLEGVSRDALERLGNKLREIDACQTKNLGFMLRDGIQWV